MTALDKAPKISVKTRVPHSKCGLKFKHFNPAERGRITCKTYFKATAIDNIAY